MRKSEIISISIVFGLILAVFLLYYSDKVKTDTINEMKRETKVHETNEKAIQSFANEFKIRSDQNHFIENIYTFVDIKVFYRDEGFLNYKVHLRIENKSKYTIQQLTVNLDYIQRNAVVKNEDIVITMLRANQTQEIKVPYMSSCDSWKWRFNHIKCNDLQIDYSEEI